MSTLAERYFASVDGRDPAVFASFFTPDARFRYGNADPELGRDAIRAAVEQFWEAVPHISHHIVGQWDDADVSIAELEVSYTRHDGGSLTLPSTTIIRLEADLIRDLRVYMDVAPVFA